MYVATTTQVARRFDVEPWRIRRLFEDGTLSEPDRLAGRRLIASSLLPQIEAALRQRGWLRASTAAPLSEVVQ